jgi:hypothetical protein
VPPTLGGVDGRGTCGGTSCAPLVGIGPCACSCCCGIACGCCCPGGGMSPLGAAASTAAAAAAPCVASPRTDHVPGKGCGGSLFPPTRYSVWPCWSPQSPTLPSSACSRRPATTRWSGLLGSGVGPVIAARSVMTCAIAVCGDTHRVNSHPPQQKNRTTSSRLVAATGPVLVPAPAPAPMPAVALAGGGGAVAVIGGLVAGVSGAAAAAAAAAAAVPPAPTICSAFWLIALRRSLSSVGAPST